MSAQASVQIGARIASSPAPGFAQVRDEVVRAYQPATAEETLLAHQIARAWFRLQKYYDLEAELLEKQDVAEMFDKDLARFKALNSAVAAAERMWRHAVNEFQRARRRAASAVPAPDAATDRSVSRSTTPSTHAAVEMHRPTANRAATLVQPCLAAPPPLSRSRNALESKAERPR